MNFFPTQEAGEGFALGFRWGRALFSGSKTPVWTDSEVALGPLVPEVWVDVRSLG